MVIKVTLVNLSNIASSWLKFFLLYYLSYFKYNCIIIYFSMTEKI